MSLIMRLVHLPSRLKRLRNNVEVSGMKKKRDILFLCQYFYPEYVSSATLPYDTAKALVKAGYKVSVLCGYPGEYTVNKNIPKRETHEGIEIERVKYIQLKRNSFWGRIINFFSFTCAIAFRFFRLKNFRAIIVYSNPPVLPIIAAWASKFYGTKMVFVSYDVYPEIAQVTNNISENGLLSSVMKFTNKRVCKYANRVIALSSEMKKFLLDHRELSEEQVSVIPNWSENLFLGEITSSYKNKKFSRLDPSNSFIVSYLGNLGICQELDTILESIRRFKHNGNIKFVFAGHGNKLNYLKEIIEQENLTNIFIYEFLHGQDYLDALNISDCFLLSLIDGVTGLAVPSKTYSYMAAGKPILAVIGQDSDIAKDLTRYNAGFVISTGDVSKLEASIKRLINNSKLKVQMGTNAKNISMAKHVKEKCIPKYIEIMNEVLEDN